MKKFLIFIALIFTQRSYGLVVVSDQFKDVGLGKREMFDIQMTELRRMFDEGIIKRSEAHASMKGLVSMWGYYYGCSLRDLDRVTYHECMFNIAPESPAFGMVKDPEGGGGVSIPAKEWAKAAGAYVGFKVIDRVADRVMDHAERKVAERIKADEQRNAERRAESDRYRSGCAHRQPSIRSGDC